VRCTAALISRTYVFAAFDGRWPGVTFLILALSGKLALGPIAPGIRDHQANNTLPSAAARQGTTFFPLMGVQTAIATDYSPGN
jgi:hypothetical protein